MNLRLGVVLYRSQKVKCQGQEIPMAKRLEIAGKVTHRFAHV